MTPLFKVEVDKKIDIIRGVAIFDLHHPMHDRALLPNIFSFIEDFKPNVFVLGGDNMNMDAISHWLLEKGDRRHLEGKRLKKDYEDFQREVLDPLAKILPEHCRKIFMLGNHDGEWIEKYIDKIPELEGFAEIEKNLKLEDWEVYPYRQTAKIGKIIVHHGEYTGKHHAAKMVDTFERNIMYGHLHTYQVFTKITPIDCEAHSAYSMPCACDMNPDYMRDKPSAWLNGFGVFYIHPDQNFNIYPIIATNGHFVFNEKYY